MAAPYHRLMSLELSDGGAAAPGNDRYPFSERIRTLKAILAKPPS